MNEIIGHVRHVCDWIAFDYHLSELCKLSNLFGSHRNLGTLTSAAALVNGTRGACVSGTRFAKMKWPVTWLLSPSFIGS